MAPGEAASVDELAELVGDGIYVTRLHYLGVVNPREGVITGMTRDGTFRIRDGKVAEPLVNLRFTVSMPDLLADVPGLTRDDAARQPERLLRRPLGVRLPRARDSRPAASTSPALARARVCSTRSAGSRPGDRCRRLSRSVYFRRWNSATVVPAKASATSAREARQVALDDVRAAL